MRVEITNPPGSTFVEGTLKDVISEHDGFSPYFVIELDVAKVGPMKVMLDCLDLATIVRLARASKVQKIRDAVSY